MTRYIYIYIYICIHMYCDPLTCRYLQATISYTLIDTIFEESHLVARVVSVVKVKIAPDDVAHTVSFAVVIIPGAVVHLGSADIAVPVAEFITTDGTLQLA